MALRPFDSNRSSVRFGLVLLLLGTWGAVATAQDAPPEDAVSEDVPAAVAEVPVEVPVDDSGAPAVADASVDGPPVTTNETDGSVGGTTAGAVAMSEFQRELRTVEEGVSSLKERVFRAKATLELLKELVIDAADSGARVVLTHANELSSGYAMESVQYFLDGRNVYSRVDNDGFLQDNREFQVHEQTVNPGTHEVSVSMVLRGRGFKVFSYLKNYEFKLQSSYAFDVEEGMISVVRVISDTRGGMRSFVERPTVQYEERTETFREE